MFSKFPYQIVLVLLMVLLAAPAQSVVEDCADYSNSVKLVNQVFTNNQLIKSQIVEWPLIFALGDAGISVTDLSDWNNPTTSVSWTRPSLLSVSRLEKNNDLGLLSVRYTTLYSMDFSDPFNSAIMDSFEIEALEYDTIRNFKITDTRAFIATRRSGLFILDITDPENLQQTGHWADYDIELNDGLAINTGALYVGSDKGLVVLDISNPDLPQERMRILDYGNFLKVDDGVLQVASFNGSKIYDLSHPLSPLLVKDFEHGYPSTSAIGLGYTAIKIYGHTIQLDRIYDLGTNDESIQIGNTSGWYGELAFSNGYLINASNGVLLFYELNKAEAIQISDIVPLQHDIIEVAVDGDHVFTIDGGKNFNIFKITPKNQIEIISQTVFPNYLAKIEIFNDRAIIYSSNSLEIWDISDQTNPIATGQSWPNMNYITIFEKCGNYLLVGRPGELNVFDFTHPDHISLSQTLPINPPGCIAYENNIVFMAGDNNTVSRYSLANGQLNYLDSFSLPFYPNGMAVRNDLLVAHFSGYMHQLFDISEPINPIPLDQYFTLSRGQTEFVNDDLLISDLYSLRFYNVNDYAELEHVGDFWGDFEMNFVLGDGRILLKETLQIVPPPCSWGQPESEKVESGYPPPPTLLSAAPNPFNPGTIISFNLHEPGYCDLSVLDLRGRRVRTLVSGSHSPGKQEVFWDGKDDEGRSVPSGVYFARVKESNMVRQHKMVLLK